MGDGGRGWRDRLDDWTDGGRRRGCCRWLRVDVAVRNVHHHSKHPTAPYGALARSRNHPPRLGQLRRGSSVEHDQPYLRQHVGFFWERWAFRVAADGDAAERL